MSKQLQLKSKESTSGFTSSNIQREVMQASLQHPSVLYPAATGLLSGFAYLLMGPAAILTWLAVGGVTLASAMWGINYGLRKDYFSNEYIRKLREEVEKQLLARTEVLSKALDETGFKIGQNQFSRLNDKFDTFKKILEEKLTVGEFTYSRYLGMAEQVYLSALDNLYTIINMKKSLKSIDIDYVKKRLNKLKKNDDTNVANEEATLQERLELFSRQESKIEEIFAVNEEAMTKLDLTIIALTQMKTGNEHASLDLETAISELGRLAERVDAYSKVSEN